MFYHRDTEDTEKRYAFLRDLRVSVVKNIFAFYAIFRAKSSVM